LISLVTVANSQSRVGELAPDFTLSVWDGDESVSLSDYEGSIVVLDFFAYWCPPCVTSSPDLEENVQQYYEQRGGTPEGIPVQVLAVNIESGRPDSTDAFIEEAGLELVLDDSAARAVYSHYSTGGIPLFAIINGVAGSPSHQQWEILHHQAGYSGAEYFRSVINRVEAGDEQPPPAVSLALNPSSRSHDSNSADNQLVIVSGNVAWTASRGDAAWITLGTTSGEGDGTIPYSLSANGADSARTGTITVSGGGLVQAFTVTQAGSQNSGSKPWYSGTSEIANKWRYYDWFKGFKPQPGSNWIFHGRHGWLFVLADDTNRMFLWDTAIGRWLFTNATTYPWMYAYGPDAGWVFFFEGGSPGERFFKRGDTGQTVSEQQLRVNPE